MSSVNLKRENYLQILEEDYMKEEIIGKKKPSLNP